jgi:hypothetical protein
MIWTFPDPVFVELVTRVLPSLSRMPRISAALTKYTSGYLTEKRLSEAMKSGSLPVAVVTPLPRPDDPTEKVHDQQGLGHHVRGSDVISLKGAVFEEYKKGHPGSRVLAPVTLFHELAHWGYDMGQRKGHPSDPDGRKHLNHGNDLSPLDAEVESAMRESWPSVPGM